MNDSFFADPTKSGTAGGMLTVLLMNFSSGDIIKTMVFAAIGAVVSFSVSLLLRKIFKHWKS